MLFKGQNLSLTTDICITTQTTYEKDLTPRQVAGGTLQKVGLSINGLSSAF